MTSKNFPALQFGGNVAFFKKFPNIVIKNSYIIIGFVRIIVRNW